MASSYVHPVARFHAPRVKFRPKMATASPVPLRRPTHAVTEERTSGVEESTVAGRLEPALPPGALIQEAINTALDSLDLLEQQARDVSRRFRRGAVREANVGLAQLVQSTQTLLKLADLTATASGTDVESICALHGISAPDDTSEAVSRLVREQLAHDWVAAAGVLDCSLLAALAGWRLVFEALSGSPTGPYGTAA